jgi:D-alanyl-D-alanine carboxypeptidase
MSPHNVSGPLAWRDPAVTLVITVAALGLFAAGCGGTQPPASAVPRPSPGGTSAGPAGPLPTGTMTTQGPALATVASRTPSAPVSAPAGPVFQASTSSLTAAMRTRMTGVSWHPGCPVPLSALRLLRLSYWGFDHAVHRGELIVNASAAAGLTQAFAQLFEVRFPIWQMRVVDDFGGDDEHSMLADNTSAFNCRLVPGTNVWAQHAYGLAVDINPFENPEIQGGQVDPAAAAAWADRSRVSPAMIKDGDAAWRAFRAIGWTWGGDWRSLKDYMHFSANGL